MQSSYILWIIKKIKKSEHFTGIGINNVDDRIKLIYGMDYGINIVSEKIKGQQITNFVAEKGKRTWQFNLIKKKIKFFYKKLILL